MVGRLGAPSVTPRGCRPLCVTALCTGFGPDELAGAVDELVTGKEVLLVVDNCERFITSLAPLVEPRPGKRAGCAIPGSQHRAAAHSGRGPVVGRAPDTERTICLRL